MYVGGIVGRSYTATISDCVVGGTAWDFSHVSEGKLPTLIQN